MGCCSEAIAQELRRIGDLLEAMAQRPPPAAPPKPERESILPLQLDDDAQRRFEALRAWRLERAREEKVPPYIIAPDRALRAAARDKPTHLAALRRVPGFGPARTERHGAAVLEVLAKA